MPLFGPKWPLSRGDHDTYQLYRESKNQVNFYLKCFSEIDLVEVIMISTDKDIDENSLTIKIVYAIEERLEEFEFNTNSTKEIGFY